MAKYPESLDDTPPPPRRRWGFMGRNLPGLSIVLMVALLVGVVLWPYMVITVPSGQVGVLWYRFIGFDAYCWCMVNRGTVLNPKEIREEGLHIIAPWNRLFIYDLRLQSKSEIYHAISKDGVSVIAEINTRYQLLHNSVGVLHKFIGPEYFETILNPEIGAEARAVIARYTAQEVYTSRDRIQQEIRDDAQRILADKLNKLVQPAAMEETDPQHYNDFLASSILILDTLVLGIDLPPEIVAAINRQTEQFYMIQEYKFRVEREAEESRRKMVEANGIAAFQRTVSQGISDSYLRWQGINATLALAQSPNTKIVIDRLGQRRPAHHSRQCRCPSGARGYNRGRTKTAGRNGPGSTRRTRLVGTSPNVGATSAASSQLRAPAASMAAARRPRSTEPNAQPAAAGNRSDQAVQVHPSVLQDVGSVLSRIYGGGTSV